MKQALIRKLDNNDLNDFEKIFTVTIQKEFPEYSQNIRDYFTDDYVQIMLKAKIKLGAFLGDKLTGYLVAAEKPFGGILFVNWLAVLGEYQKKGIGKLLLNKIDDIALELGAHAIHVEVSKRNIKFYELCGYKVFGYDEKGYFGTDNYLLKRELQEPSEEKFLKEYLSKIK